MDELSPLFHDIEFNERFRGYDVEEVDAYVDRVAKAAALVQGRIAELQDRVAAAEAQPRTVVAATAPASEGGDLDDGRLSRVLVLAQRTADAAIEEAQAEADAMRAEAGAEAERVRREADDHASLVLAEAETDRRRMITEAEEAAAGAVAAERARVAAEVAELERHRAFLSDDIAILEQHLAETRLSVAASLSALTDLLEAPEAFRAPAMPATSGVDVPAGLIEGRAAGAVEDTAPAPTETVDDGFEPDEPAMTQPAVVADDVVDDAPIDLVENESVQAESVEPERAIAVEATADDVAPLAPAASITFDPSEPTQVFDTIGADPIVAEPAPEAPIEPTAEPEPMLTDTVAASTVLEAPAEAEVETAPASEIRFAPEIEAEIELDVAPVAEHEDQPEVAAEEVPVEPVAAPEPEPNLVFDIDLLDAEPEPVVDLTEPPVDLAAPEVDVTDATPDTGGSATAADGDAATATAPPRLVTAEDIETTGSETWIDDLRDAATPETEEPPGDLLFAPPESTANDHFLDQLRDAVGTDEPEEFAEDALAAFFDDGEEDDNRGWFNRRR
ncbi:MAG: DivIVA domain-containing protein [Actinomycetota bacterium]